MNKSINSIWLFILGILNMDKVLILCFKFYRYVCVCVYNIYMLFI